MPTIKTGFSVNVLKLITGSTVNQLTTVIAAPLLAHLYMPDAFGIFAVLLSIANIIGVVACLRYEHAILLPERDDEAINLFVVSLISTLMVTTLTVALVLFAGGAIGTVLHAPEAVSLLWWVPALVMATGVTSALVAWNTRQRKFARLSAKDALAGASASASQVAFGMVGITHAVGLLTGRITSAIVGFVLLGRTMLDFETQQVTKYLSVRGVVSSANRFRRFPLLESWGALTNSLSWQLPALLLAAFFAPATVGYYALTYRLIKLPMSSVGKAIGRVFFQSAAELRHSKLPLADDALAVFNKLATLALLPTVLVALVGKELFTTVFGSEWAESGVYLQILAPWMFFWFISSPMSTLFLVLERQDLSLGIYLANLATRTVSLIIGGMADNVYLALALFSGSGILVYGVLVVTSLALAGASLLAAARTTLHLALTALPVANTVVTLKTRSQGPEWPLLATSLLLLVAYYTLHAYREPAVRRFLSAYVLKAKNT